MAFEKAQKEKKDRCPIQYPMPYRLFWKYTMCLLYRRGNSGCPGDGGDMRDMDAFDKIRGWARFGPRRARHASCSLLMFGLTRPRAYDVFDDPVICQTEKELSPPEFQKAKL